MHSVLQKDLVPSCGHCVIQTVIERQNWADTRGTGQSQMHFENVKIITILS